MSEEVTAGTDADGGETIVIRKDFGVFMAGLWEQSKRDYDYTVNSLIDAANARADRAETTLAMVREVIGGMMDSDFMPTSAAIMRALYPSWDLVERIRAERALP